MKKKVALITLLVLAITVSVSGCIGESDNNSTSSTSSDKKTFNEKGVYFQYPSNWNDLTVEDVADGANRENFVTAKGIKEEAHFWVYDFSNMDGSGLTSEAWAKNTKKEIDGSFNIDSEGTTMINGVETYYLTTDGGSYGNIYTKQYFYVDGDKIYHITYLDTKKDFATCDEVVKTLKIS